MFRFGSNIGYTGLFQLYRTKYHISAGKIIPDRNMIFRSKRKKNFQIQYLSPLFQLHINLRSLTMLLSPPKNHRYVARVPFRWSPSPPTPSSSLNNPKPLSWLLFCFSLAFQFLLFCPSCLGAWQLYPTFTTNKFQVPTSASLLLIYLNKIIIFFYCFACLTSMWRLIQP